jgi:hypothetical protein
MRKLMMISLLALTTSLAFGQKQMKNDPSYYKHPNKKVYVNEDDLSASKKLEMVNVVQNNNYKHPLNTPVLERKHAINTQKGKQRKSYKHPFGLW